MTIFKRRLRKSTLVCPACGGTHLGLGYVDRVRCTVLHSCGDCGERWHDQLIDLADEQLRLARAGR